VSHLIQILLPLDDNDGKPLPRDRFEKTRAELLERHGGITAHAGAPAEGVWKEGSGAVLLDRIVVLEVLVDSVDHAWWAGYRARLEERFRQKSILVRAVQCETL
jgi:hypothetical protein